MDPVEWNGRRGTSGEERLIVHQTRLRRRIREMIGPGRGDEVESSDVLQTVCVEALESLRGGRLRGRDLLPWMLEAARHRIVDHVRRWRRDAGAVVEEDLADRGGSPPSQLVVGELHAGLAEALAELEPERRLVLSLRNDEGLSWHEVARRLGRSEEAVRKLYHRSLLLLGEKLERRQLR